MQIGLIRHRWVLKQIHFPLFQNEMSSLPLGVLNQHASSSAEEKGDAVAEITSTSQVYPRTLTSGWGAGIARDTIPESRN